MTNAKSEIPKLIDKLLVCVLDPPDPHMAIMMIEETARLHIASLTGLLKQADTQEAVDQAYELIDNHFLSIKDQLHGVMYVIASHRGFKARNLSDINLQTRLDIEAQLKKEEKNV